MSSGFIEFEDLNSPPASWREKDSDANCTVILNENCVDYRIHLEVVSRSSRYFYRVATNPRTLGESDVVPDKGDSAGSVTVKITNGTELKVGKLSHSVGQLKFHIYTVTDIPVSDQRIFFGHCDKKELREEWRSLARYGVKDGDSLLLVPREAWQKIERKDDAQMVIVTLNLPEHCANALESVFDCMYSYGRDENCFALVSTLKPEKVLGALWLAGLFEMADLQRHLAKWLESNVNERNAHEYLPAAVELGFVTVRNTLIRLAAPQLVFFERQICRKFPLDVVASLVRQAPSYKRTAKHRLLATFLEGQEQEETLDDEMFQRVIGLNTVDSTRLEESNGPSVAQRSAFAASQPATTGGGFSNVGAPIAGAPSNPSFGGVAAGAPKFNIGAPSSGATSSGATSFGAPSFGAPSFGTSTHSQAATSTLAGSGRCDKLGDSCPVHYDEDDDDNIDGKDELILLRMAQKFGCKELEDCCSLRAAEIFYNLKSEELRSLPVPVLKHLLEQDGLAVASEDDVYQIVAEYVASLEDCNTEEVRKLWVSVRFALCSSEVRAKLMKVPDAGENLRLEWLHQATPKYRVKRSQIGSLACASGTIIGSSGDGFGQLNSPQGLVMDSEGFIFVTDHGHHRVNVFHKNGSAYTTIGLLVLRSPSAVALDRDRCLVVADSGNGRIVVFRRDGSIKQTLAGNTPGAASLRDPRGVAVCKDGSIIVTEREAHQVNVFGPDGVLERSFGSYGEQLGFLSSPQGVAVNSKGWIVVADSGNHRVQVFRRDGSVIHCFGSEGNGPGQFRRPQGITVDARNDIVVADTGNNRLQTFIFNGEHKKTFVGVPPVSAESPPPDSAVKPLQIVNPIGVAVDGSGKIIFSDAGCSGRGRGGGRILVLEP